MLACTQEALELGAAMQADGVAVRKRHAQELARLQAQQAASAAAAEGLEAQHAAQVTRGCVGDLDVIRCAPALLAAQVCCALSWP